MTALVTDRITTEHAPAVSGDVLALERRHLIRRCMRHPRLFPLMRSRLEGTLWERIAEGPRR